MKNVTEAELANAKPVEASKPELPKFEPKWWYRNDRLDARPVIWSLENHPEDWNVYYGSWRGGYVVVEHKPSAHRFRIIDGIFLGYSADLYDANCGCASITRRFQAFQAGALAMAVKTFCRLEESARLREMQKDFLGHFVR